MKIAIFLISIFILQACSHHNPRNLSKPVELSFSKPSSSCTKVGKISVLQGGTNPRSWTTNKEQQNIGYRRMRDKAATQGANYVMVHKKSSRTKLCGTAYWCPEKC